MPLWWWVAERLAVIVSTTQQVSLRPERPEGVWPVSVSGWVGLFASLIALVAVVWRANNKPVLDRLTLIEQKFDREVNRIESRLDDEEAYRKREAQHLVTQIEEKLNGFGQRVEINRKDIDHLEDAIGRQALEMMEYKSNQRSIDIRVTELNTKADTLVNQLPALELRINTSMHNQTKEILRETANLITAAFHPSAPKR